MRYSFRNLVKRVWVKAYCLTASRYLLLKLMLYHLWSQVAFPGGQFHMKHSGFESLRCLKTKHSQLLPNLPGFNELFRFLHNQVVKKGTVMPSGGNWSSYIKCRWNARRWLCPSLIDLKKIDLFIFYIIIYSAFVPLGQWLSSYDITDEFIFWWFLDCHRRYNRVIIR